MNWKKWDENTWINMSNGHKLVFCKKDVKVMYVCGITDNIIESKLFNSRSEAVAFIEALLEVEKE